MKHAVSRELHAYWDRLRGTRAAPERSDLDPAAIRAILADTFLVDIAGSHAFGPRDFVIRLAGTRLNALWGEDMKGRSLLSLWRSEDRSTLLDLLDLVLDDQISVVSGAQAMSLDKNQVELETLLLPLRHHGKTHARLLGSIVPNPAPRWIGHHPLGELTLTSFRAITSGYPIVSQNQPPEFSRIKPPTVRHGRFTVHQGGR